MNTFRELIEAKRLPNQDLEGVEADKVMRELEKDNNKKVTSKADTDGLQIDSIITKNGNFYIVYRGAGDEVMRIVINPNTKQKKEFNDSFEDN